MFKPKIKAKDPGNYGKAYDYAMYLLNLQLRTSGELEYKMQEKGYANETIHKVLEELAASRYVDDKSFAAVYLENLKKYKTFGFYGIKKKLMEKRLPQNLIEHVLNEGLSEEEELKIAERFIKKTFSFGLIPSTSKESHGQPETEILLPINRDQDDAGDKFSQDAESVKKKYEIKQKIAQKLRARGFRGGVIAKLMF